jgi:hypothetical protein
VKLYEVNAQDGEPSTTYATKREAMKEARRAAREYAPIDGGDVEIDEIVIDRVDKALVVRLINGEGGYVSDRRTIATVPNRRKAGL